MNAPLWRIFLHILLLAFVVQRAGMGVILYLDGAGIGLLAAFALQCVAGVVASFAILFGKRWEVGAVIATAVTVAVGAFYAALGSALLSVAAAVSQALIAAIACAALVAALRHERDQTSAERGGDA